MNAVQSSAQPRGPRSSRVRHRLGGPLGALVALTGVAMVWGSSYPLTKVLFDELTARQFLAIRFSLAAAAMLIVFWRAVRALSRRAWWHGTVLGLMYGAAQILQTVGLAHTPATISGFITGLYVVLTPLCAAVLLRTRIDRRAWLGAILAVVGLGVLALQGLSLGLGEWLTLGSALVFALHILGLGAWARASDALGMAVVQMVAVAVLCSAATVPRGFAAPSSTSGWLILLYLAIVSGGVAMIVQTWAQSQMSPSRAAIVMSTEPAWAALLAITLLAEPLTWRLLVGGALMLVAMIVVETGPRAPTDPAGPEDLPKLAG